MSRAGIAILITAQLALWPLAAHALELKDFKVSDDGKKIHLDFELSAAAEIQIISNYAGNFVAVSAAELQFPKNLARRDHPPEDAALEQFYRFVRFQQTAGEGQIRVYLGKLATPADVQVIQMDKLIEIELLKPLWKLGSTEAEPSELAPPDSAAPADGAEQPPAEPAGLPEGGFRFERQPEPGNETEPQPAAPADVEPAGPEAAGEESPAPAGEPTPAFIPDEPAPEETPDTGGETPRAQGGEVYGQTSYGEILGQPDEDGLDTPHGWREPAPQPEAKPREGGDAQPPRAGMPKPSYKQFDLSKVPVASVEIKGLPFDEALAQLVAGAGFNVVVGQDIEDTEVNLNFTKKDVSLKSALDLLCLAYDLAYTVEDDAIIIRGK